MDPILELNVGSGRIVVQESTKDESDEEAIPSLSSTASAVSALCFLPASSNDTGCYCDSVSDDDDSIELLSEALKLPTNGSTTAQTSYTELDPSSRWLGTALSNGEVLLWDLNQRKVVQNLLQSKNGTVERRLAALRLTRLDNSNAMLLHTRDGILTRHESNQATNTIYATLTSTFCAAAACIGDANLVIAPDVKGAAVIDWRQSDTIAHCIELNRHSGENHGSIMSLAMLKHGAQTLVACGMEDGSIHLRDLRYSPNRIARQGIIIIGKEPVLSMDMRPSTKDPSSVALIAAGMAGNVADLSSVAVADQGRGVIVKVSKNDAEASKISARIRTRFKSWQQPGQNQHLAAPEHWYKGNRAAISVCKFDHTDQIVAMGGWDYRVRFYHRTSMDGRPLALLRGHANSITALDWAPESSVLATGSADGAVMLWNFPRPRNR